VEISSMTFLEDIFEGYIGGVILKPRDILPRIFPQKG
jgi:hypothetical protein